MAFSLGNIDWPMDKKAGVVNIRPDDLAILGMKSPSLSQFVLYLEGFKDGSYTINSEDDFYKLFK
jgi:hypothetical protein